MQQNRFAVLIAWISFLCVTWSLVGCGSRFSTEKFSAQAAQSVGCSSFKDDFWDVLYRQVLQRQEFPSTQEFAQSLEPFLSTERFARLDQNAKNEIKSTLANLYGTLTDDALADKTQEPLQMLAALELGDRTDERKELLQTRIAAALNHLKSLSQTHHLECATPPAKSAPPPSSLPNDDTNTADTKDDFPSNNSRSSPWLEQVAQTQPRSVFGAWKAMATAYQSCDSVDQLPLTNSTEEVQGIKVVGKHPTNVGSRRIIDDINSVRRTHPYLKTYQHTSDRCLDSRDRPLIYDYGGKPYATEELSSTLDFFTDSGSGSPELGTDCSGFIYTSLAAAGLKLKVDGRLKAVTVSGIAARMLMDPQKNGLSCLEPVSIQRHVSLQPGDILASTGHVVMVDTVGPDPFGINSINSITQCVANRLDPDKFDFTIIQSSPIFGAVGINRVHAKEYLVTQPDLIRGVLAFAVEACRARLGATPRLPSSSATFVRHRTSDPNCIDRAIPLWQEQCLDACPINAPLAAASHSTL